MSIQSTANGSSSTSGLETGTLFTYGSYTPASSSLAEDAQGNLYLAYRLENEAGIAIDRWTGAAWSEITRLTTAMTGDTAIRSDLSLQVGTDGNLELLFRHDNNVDGTGLNSLRGVKFGAYDIVHDTWTTTLVDQAQDPSGNKTYDMPVLAVSPDGSLHAVYNYTDDTGYYVKYATSLDGGATWATSVISTGPRSDTIALHYPAIQVDSAGTVYVFYASEDDLQHQDHGSIYLIEKVAGSSTWSSAQKVLDQAASQPAIAGDGAGHFYIGYVDYTYDGDGNIIASNVKMTSNEGGAWVTDTGIVSDNRIDTISQIQYADGKLTMLANSMTVDYTDPEGFLMRKDADGWQVGYRGAELPVLSSSESGRELGELHVIVRADGSVMVVDETGDGVNAMRNVGYVTGSAADFGLFSAAAPVVDGLDGDVTPFTPGATDLALDQAYIDAQPTQGDTVQVTDADSTSFQGGNITIAQSAGTHDGHFEIDASGEEVAAGADASHLGSALAAGGKVFLFISGAWTEVGQVDATQDGQNGRGLKIDFSTAAATPDAAQTIIKYLMYGAATPGARSFALSVDDGAGQVSTPAVFSMTGTDNVAPTVTGITSASANGAYKIGATIDVAVHLSEAVTVSGTPTLLLETGAVDHAATYQSGSGTDTLVFAYTVQAGDLATDLDIRSTTALSLNGGSIADAAGNPAVVTLPTPGAAGSLGANAALLIDGAAPTDILLSNAQLSTQAGANATVGSLSTVDGTPGDSFTYSLVSGAGDTDNPCFQLVGAALHAIDPAALGAGAKSVRVHTADAAGNAYDKVLSVTLISAPTVAIASDRATLVGGETAAITFTFSSAPTGFDAGDITVAGGTLSALTVDAGDSTIYHATFTPAANTQHVAATISVAASAFTDANGVANAAGGNVAIGGDTLAPSVTLSADRDDFTAGSTATVTFTFSEAPGDFALGDVSVGGGTLANLAATANPTVYTATFTPTAGLQHLIGAVSIGAGTFIDAAGNANTASTVNLALSGDTLAPLVSAGALTLSGVSGTGGIFRVGDTVSVAWDDSAAGDHNGDTAGATVDFSAFGGGSAVAATLANGVWHASYQVSAGAIDAAGLHAAITVTDGAGNVTTHATVAAALDNQAPVVLDAALAIGGGSGTGGAYRIGDTVTATWAAAGNADVAAASFDFSQFGGGSAVAATLAGGVWQAQYTVAEAAIDAVNRNVAVTVRDDAGNGTTTADSANVHVDAIRPHVASITVAGTPAADATNVDFTLTFNEAVSGVDAADLTLAASGAALGQIASVSGSGTTYTVHVDGIAGSGGLQVQLSGSGTGIVDAAGNAAQGAYTAGATYGTAFNAAPVIASNGGGATAALSVAEKQRAVTTVTASDADNDTLAYSITGGTDAALFEIDAATGQLRFKSAPLVATPADSDHDNAYQVLVTAADGRGASASQAVTVTVLKDQDGDGIADIDDSDIDNDGRPNSAEDPVPGAFGVVGDGNGDGIADSAQINVASLPTVVAGAPFATLEVAAGLTLGAVSSLPGASGLPRNVKMPVGQFDFTIGGVTPGASASVSVYVDAALMVNGYYKQNAAGTWVNLATSVTTVGSKTKVTFALTDGGVYDSDHAVNGSISDPGGLGTATPLIGSLANVRVLDGAQAVTTIAASAAGAVVYSIAGGADAALFTIDATSGALRFVSAPSHAAPQDAGHDNTYEVKVQASDAYGSDTQTLAVSVVTPPVVTPPVVTPPTEIDGVAVTTGTEVNVDGSTSTVITIPVVQPGRVDSVGGNHVADVPLVTGAGGSALLSAQVPVGVGLQVSGTATAVGAGDALTNLIREIRGVTEAGSHDQTAMTGGGSGFLAGLASDANLLVHTVTPTAAAGSTAVDAIVIKGVPTAAGTPLEALVIDAQHLPAGSEIQLQDVAFAAIVGAVRVTGGAGSQSVWADGHSQSIILGADDDILHGGAGDDTVGSEGGNDQIFGDEGNDVVFGGLGNDTIDGGSGTDTVQFVGAGRADYSIRMNDSGDLVFTHAGADGADGIDTVANVEVLRFMNAQADTSAQGSVERLAEAVTGSAPTAAALQGWLAELDGGATLAQVAAHMLDAAPASVSTQSDGAFVQTLYANVFERTADAAGAAYWVDALAHGASRADVTLALADSAEKLAMPVAQDIDVGATDVGTLVRMYDTLFGRAPDVGGVNYWLSESEAGMALATIADGFIASMEGVAQYGALDDSAFVASLYRVALHRDGAASEVAWWTVRLESGALDRGDVLLQFAESAEKVGLVGVISTSVSDAHA